MKHFENLEVLNIDTSLYKTRISKKYRNRKPYHAPDQHQVLSFIPGTVIDVLVVPGTKVCRGESLLIVDAMKMQNHLKAGIDGCIKQIMVKKGDRVAKGDLLIEID